MVQIDSLNMLQYIDMLLKHGNYTKAAKDLYISQPYLTQTIKKVEQELEIEIINRHITPLQLTEAGKVYYQYLNSLETEQDLFRKKIAKYSSPDSSILRVGILSSLGTYVLPLFLSNYMEKHPEVKIELHEAIPEENEEKLLKEGLDVLIGQNPETISPNLTVHVSGKHGYYAIIPESSDLFQKGRLFVSPETIPIKALLKETLVLTSRGSAIRRQIDYLIQKHAIHSKIVLESNNIFTVVELAKQNMGVTFAPESVTVPSTNQSAFNIYPLSLDILSLDYFIAHPANKTLIPAEKDFIEAFLKEMERHVHKT